MRHCIEKKTIHWYYFKLLREWLIGKDLEVDSCDLYGETILEFAWRKKYK
jgi:hypothetical protein